MQEMFVDKHETIVEGHKHIHVRIHVHIQPNTHTRLHLHCLCSECQSDVISNKRG